MEDNSLHFRYGHQKNQRGFKAGELLCKRKCGSDVMALGSNLDFGRNVRFKDGSREFWLCGLQQLRLVLIFFRKGNEGSGGFATLNDKEPPTTPYVSNVVLRALTGDALEKLEDALKLKQGRLT
jgi:hypothetical protein